MHRAPRRIDRVANERLADALRRGCRPRRARRRAASTRARHRRRRGWSRAGRPGRGRARSRPPSRNASVTPTRPGTSCATDSSFTCTSPIAPIGGRARRGAAAAAGQPQARGEPAAQQQRRGPGLGALRIRTDVDLAQAAGAARVVEEHRDPLAPRRRAQPREVDDVAIARAGAPRGAARRRRRGPRSSRAARTARGPRSASTASQCPCGAQTSVVRSVITSGSTIESRCSRCPGPTSRITVSWVSTCSPSCGRRASAATDATASIVVRPVADRADDRARRVIAPDAPQAVRDLAAPLALDDADRGSARAPGRSRRSRRGARQQPAQRRLDLGRRRVLGGPDGVVEWRRNCVHPRSDRPPAVAVEQQRVGLDRALACRPGTAAATRSRPAQADTIGSQIRHCASTSSLRVNSVASPRIASRISRS